MSSPRVALVLRGLATAGLLGVAAVAISGVFSPAPEADVQSGGAVFPVTVDTSELRLACPPGLLDPMKPEGSLADAAVWLSNPVEEVALKGGGSAVDPGEVSGSDDFPEAISFSGIAQGEWRSLLASSCLVPRNRVTVVAGSTMVGEDLVLTLSNPSAKPVQIGVRGFGSTGPLGAIPQPLTIPAGTTQSWIPAIWFPNEPRLALSLEADGEGIAAWIQSSGRNGEVSTGLGRQGAKPVSTVNVLPGISEAAGKPTLSLLNPTETPLAITVEISEGEGTRQLPGTEELVVDPGAVFQVDLAGIGTAPVSVVATASEPFAASVAYRIIGADDPVVAGEKVSARTLVGPSSAALQFRIPSLADLQESIGARGFTDPVVRLIVTNTGDEKVRLRSGKLDEAVAPGATLVVDQSTWGDLGDIATADSPVHVALQLSATSPAGAVQALTELGFGGFESITQTVVIGP